PALFRTGSASTPSSPWRPLVKGVSAAALAAAVASPLMRKKHRIPARLTVAALSAGPPALAVVRPRTRLRDAGMYALPRWVATMGPGLPYDPPEAVRSPLRGGYPIRVDRLLGAGELPSVRLQRALA